MSLRWLIALIVCAWCSLTAGVYMAIGSLAVLPLSLGLALGALAFVYGRAEVLKVIAQPKPQEPKR